MPSLTDGHSFQQTETFSCFIQKLSKEETIIVCANQHAYNVACVLKYLEKTYPSNSSIECNKEIIQSDNIEDLLPLSSKREELLLKFQKGDVVIVPSEQSIHERDSSGGEFGEFLSKDLVAPSSDYSTDSQAVFTNRVKIMSRDKKIITLQNKMEILEQENAFMHRKMEIMEQENAKMNRKLQEMTEKFEKLFNQINNKTSLGSKSK
ncbi:hypothetical protein FDP41_010659 [Naegleria fowleri]|uniref:Uncharacterized protein n=1 Tax=Naegleria fowleri TaxID=5763 RepID=A0A6A5CAM8_NAEFO|nr:uncharacterized protein FDP41_010659 [Naegleria fowleri]KAF0983594.1 hypothetical protein FDP41_010659 [Naegleria fowleri]